MSQSKLLLIPMSIHFFSLAVLFVYTLIKRKSGVKDKIIPAKYFTNYQDKSVIPGKFLILERHIDNQFQLPIIFYIICTLFISLNSATSLTLLLASLFIVSRGLHSWEHLGRNHILVRAKMVWPRSYYFIFYVDRTINSYLLKICPLLYSQRRTDLQ